MGDQIGREQRFHKWEAWLLLASVLLAFVGGYLFLFAAVSHSVSRWFLIPGWVVLAVGVLTGRLLIGQANRREGKPFIARRHRVSNDFRDLAVACRTVGLPIPVGVVALVIGYAVLILGFVHAGSAAFTP